MYSHAHFYLLIDPFVYISRISHTNTWAISNVRSKTKLKTSRELGKSLC